MVRSLPFFVTALGLAVALFAQIAPRLFHLSQPGFWVSAVLLLAAGGVFAKILWCLFQIVKARLYRIPPNEVEIVAWARDLETFHRQQAGDADRASQLALADVKRAMIDSYADAAVWNRNFNAEKFAHRAEGFTYLVILIALASLSVGVIFIDKQVGHLRDGARIVETSSRADGNSDRADRTVRREQAARSKKSNGSSGDEVSRGARGHQSVREKGLTDVRERAAPATSSPAPAPAPAPAGDAVGQKESRSNSAQLTGGR